MMAHETQAMDNISHQNSITSVNSLASLLKEKFQVGTMLMNPFFIIRSLCIPYTYADVCMCDCVRVSMYLTMFYCILLDVPVDDSSSSK